jgi:hypothetical protein
MGKKNICLLILALLIAAPVVAAAADVAISAKPATVATPTASAARPQSPSFAWQASARLHRTLGSTPGTLKVSAEGVEFNSRKGFVQRWRFIDIQTLGLWPRRLVLTSYEKRGRFRPGERRFRFDLQTELPPAVAAQLARLVVRPVRNGIPDPKDPGFATLPAHHRTAFGGSRSNGALRFRDSGIDYVTPAKEDSRSWRWADIQTLSNPDSYHLVLFGFRDTYSFDLKEPLSRELFDRVSDRVYAHNIGAAGSGGGMER